VAVSQSVQFACGLRATDFHDSYTLNTNMDIQQLQDEAIVNTDIILVYTSNICFDGGQRISHLLLCRFVKIPLKVVVAVTEAYGSYQVDAQFFPQVQFRMRSNC
jgi:hypothetical protein